MSVDLVFDGPSLYARAWYATSRDYVAANDVLRSALQTVFSLINRDVDRIGKRIDRTIFCWDGYHNRDKGDRQVKPSQFYETRDIFKELLTALIGTVHYTPSSHEADDAVATVVERSTAENVYVVSGDKDLMQLQADNVHYYCLNSRAVLSRAYVTTKFGVKHPRQIAIAQAIIGDKIDNIPGIKGWGPSKVKTLFKSVTESMTFVEALYAVESQIPDEHLRAFYASLERTLLAPNLENAPEPSPLAFLGAEDVIEAGVDGIEDAYFRMVQSYGHVKRETAVALGMDESD